jgi:hypothetical protein
LARRSAIRLPETAARGAAFDDSKSRAAKDFVGPEEDRKNKTRDPLTESRDSILKR